MPLGLSEKSRRRRVRIVLYLIVVALVVAIAFSLQRQMSVEDKVVDAGIIESNSRPALYFTVKNNVNSYANYTYVVTQNLTGIESTDSSRITVGPNGTFKYTMSLPGPLSATVILNLKIYKGEDTSDMNALIDNETWVIKAQV